MTKAPVYYLSRPEIITLLKKISDTDYLRSVEFRLDQAGKGRKCPPEGIKEANYPSGFEKYAPLFTKHRSITAASIQQLRSALTPLVTKKRSPSTPTHICLEVQTKPNGDVAITAWNPFAGPKK